MAITEFIAAVELGSSKVSGIVGRKDVKGNVEVLAHVTESSTSFIRKGIIFNMDKAVNSVVNVVDKLEFAVAQGISKIYVGVSGQSFHSSRNCIKRDLPEGSEITENIIDSIRDENRAMEIADMDIWGVVPWEYKIGSQRYTEPVGVIGNSIEGDFLNIIARTEIKSTLERCFSNAQIELADDPFIVPLLLGDYVLNDSEKRLGCALVDFGAGITTVSVYYKNVLRFLSVIPLGGANITRDLETVLNIENDEAEELKLRYGSALLKPEDQIDEEITLRDGDRKVKLSVLMEIIEARSREIIANVWNQIRLSSYEGLIGSGLVFTGGCSNLRHLIDAFTKHTQKNMQIRIASNILNSYRISGVVIPSNGTQNGLLSMLLRGNENCCEVLSPDDEIITKEPEEPEETEDQNEIEETNDNSDEGILAVPDDSESGSIKEEPIDAVNDDPQAPKAKGIDFISKVKEIFKPKEKTQEEEEEEEQERIDRENKRREEKERRLREREEKEAIRAQKIIEERRKRKERRSIISDLGKIFDDQKMSDDSDNEGTNK